ncbi:MAG: GNAT family N-acetyltransferase, partial [Candidatus Bathyarchaeia archaeon]
MQKDPKYLIRNYKKGDEVHLAKIYSECFSPTTPRSIKKWWYRRVGVLPEHIFIGEVEGKLVSSIYLEFKKLHLGEEVYLKTGGIAGVCTDSDYRRKGIATNLMKSALNYTKQS